MTLFVSVSDSRTETEFRREIRVGDRFFHFTYRGEVLPPEAQNCDNALLATIFYAMARNEPLHIKGPVSAHLLENMEEFQRIWHKWSSRYSVVPVTADAEIDDAPVRNNAAVLAYSGGADANAALQWHLTRPPEERRRRDVAAALLIHGFDISEGDEETFEGAADLARATLAPAHVPLVTVSTNWREVMVGHWEFEFGAGLAACLFPFAGLASYGIIACDEEYSDLVFPAGSNPFSNLFFRTRAFEIQTECAGYTRTERVALLAQNPAMVENLRVCWRRPKPGHLNCGKCEKCQRTRMNFLANGLPAPPVLGDQGGIWRLAMPMVGSPVVLSFYRDIARVARRNGIRAPWFRAFLVGYNLSRLRVLFSEILRGALGRPIRQVMGELSGRPPRAKGAGTEQRARDAAQSDEPAVITPAR